VGSIPASPTISPLVQGPLAFSIFWIYTIAVIPAALVAIWRFKVTEVLLVGVFAAILLADKVGRVRLHVADNYQWWCNSGLISSLVSCCLTS
jgi:hypothetical protein